MIVAYVPDLMDRSRFPRGEIRFVSSVDDLVASAPGAAAVVVDLGRAGAADAAAAIAATGVRVIGFTNHTDDGTLGQASAAGVEAMPRSRFFRMVGELLAGS